MQDKYIETTNEVVREINVPKYKFPTAIKIVPWIIFIISGLYAALQGIILLMIIFKTSIALGLLVIFTGIGVTIIFAPAFLCFGASAMIIEVSENFGKINSYLRLIAFTILAWIAISLSYLLVAFLVGALISIWESL